jgi:hypothetical protein
MMTALSSKFGLAWDTYMQAVVWNYNISTCSSTGYSPYELMFGRVASYLQDIPFTRKPLQRTANHVGWGSDLVARNEAIYKIVRVNQAKIAAANQARSNLKKATVNFTVENKDNGITGDLVLFYEPQQTKMLKDMSPSVLDASKAPKKWTPMWTGPHTIVEKVSINHYRIFHRKRGERVKTHVNRLVIFHPWSDTIVSTSDWEGIHAYRTGEWATEGVLIIVPLLPPHPFGVAKLVKANRDGSIEYQWLGNEREDIRGTLQPGWVSGHDKNANALVYYSAEPKTEDHPPYMGNRDLPLHQKDIVVHSFELTGLQKVPMVVLRAIDEDYRIWWTMGPVETSALNGTRHEPLHAEHNESPGGARRNPGAPEKTSALNGTRHEPLHDEHIGSPGGARRNPGTPEKARAANGTRHESKAILSQNPTTPKKNIGFTGTNMILRKRQRDR